MWKTNLVMPNIGVCIQIWVLMPLVVLSVSFEDVDLLFPI